MTRWYPSGDAEGAQFVLKSVLEGLGDNSGDGLTDGVGNQEVQDGCAGEVTWDDRQDGPHTGYGPVDGGATPLWMWPLLSLPS
jgi:hypothetical protein